MNIKQVIFSFFFLSIFSSLFSQTTLTLLETYSIEDDVPEPSGLAYDKENNQLFTVSDTDDIYRLSITGDLLETYSLSGDLEGITTYNSPNTLLVAIEDEYALVEYNYVTGATTEHIVDYENQGDEKSGIEGVTYNPVTEEIYFLNEKEPGALIVADDDFNVTDEYELDFADDYSAASYVEETNSLWLGSDASSAVYRCTVTGEVLETFPMRTEDDEEFGKIEGIAIDHANNRLYLVTDETRILYVFEIGSTNTVDCAGEVNGSAAIDDCDICSGGNTGIEVNSTCEQDCAGTWGGTLVLDDCDVCGGQNACRTCGDPIASSEDEENVALNVLDGNPDTRWSANGIGEYITICLGDTLILDQILISFFVGDERSTTFDVEISLDGIIWESVIQNQESSGSTLDFESFDIIPSEVWKLRVIGKGNDTGSNWNSITRISWQEQQVVTGLFNRTQSSTTSLFPNPVNNSVTLSIPSITTKVYSISGLLIQEFNGLQSQFDLSELSTGSYLLETTNENEITEVIRFVKN